MQLSTQSNEPIYLQISNAIASQILAGDLRAGHSIASSRQLAASLGVGRGTVTRAYEELRHKQLIRMTQGGKPIVTFEPTEPACKDFIRTPTEYRLSRFGKRIQSDGVSIEMSDLAERSFGFMPPSLLPFKAWRGLLTKHSADWIEVGSDADIFGSMELRSALQQYLSRSRGVVCSPEQICILSDAQLALDLICKLLVDSEDHVLIEEPSSRAVRQILKSHGAAMVPLEVDANGLQVERIMQLEIAPKFAYVSPSHHNPTGCVMSQARREMLLKFAHYRKTLIIEDDYDGEFRYTSTRARALQGMDPDNVVYIGSVSKIMQPLTSIAYVVFPVGLLELARRAKKLVERQLPILEQQALADFIESGHLERYIGKTRQAFAARRQMLIMTLARQFGASCKVAKETAGMHQLVHFDLPNSDGQIADAAAKTSLPFISTEPFYANSENRMPGEFLIPFAFHSEQDIEAAVSAIASELRQQAFSVV